MFKKRSNSSTNTLSTKSTLDIDNTDSTTDNHSVLIQSKVSTIQPSMNQYKSITYQLNTDILPVNDDSTTTSNVDSSIKSSKYNSATVDISQDRIDSQRNTTGVKSQSASNVRQITVYDYKPDVCKDYKQTGFCSFGDSCKFIHDRTDYKQGWQIDQLHEHNKKIKLNGIESISYDELARNKVKSVESFKSSRLGFMNKSINASSTTNDTVPFACLLCKQPFTLSSQPVVTKCHHYFDERCALQHHNKSPRCAVCNQLTSGIFNKAYDVIEKIKQQHDHKSDNTQSDTSDTET